MIDILDDFLTREELDFVVDYSFGAPYYYGETDTPVSPVTGMVHEVSENSRFYNIFADRIVERYPRFDRQHIVRLYINCFAPNEHPYFHVDDDKGVDATTFLFYVTPGWNINNGGETQFYDDGVIRAVPPIQNRLISFPAHILHKATTYKNGYRFTVAIKYKFVDS